MRTFVVSLLSFFDNKMLMAKVQIDPSTVREELDLTAEALKAGIFTILQSPDVDISINACHTVDEIEEAMYHMDMSVGILKI